MGGMALAAAVNLPLFAEQLLAKQQEEAAAAGGDAGTAVMTDILQQSKPALVSAATAVAAAATALAGATSQDEDGGKAREGSAAAAAAAAATATTAAAAIAAAPTAEELARLLEREVVAMSALLDGRWACLLPTVGACSQHHSLAWLADNLPCFLAWPCSALSEHLEPLYLANLAAAITKLREPQDA